VIALAALTVGVLFGVGVVLMLTWDLIRMAAGAMLISSAATLFIMSAGLSPPRVPIHPLPPGGVVSDPLPQALALTAIVISFGTTALLLVLAFAVHRTHDVVDLDELARLEREAEHGVEPESA
jgi:multicomponent Na+:H+ antiporter subunit C